MPDIDELVIQINSNSQSAVDGVEALADSLGRLKQATSGGLGLTSISRNLENIKDAVSGIGNIGNNLQGLTKAILTLKQLGSIKVSASIGSQITKIGTALSTLNIGDGASKITELVDALKPLETLGKSSLNTTVNALKKLPDAINKIDMRKLHGQVDALTRTFKPLADEMQKIANGFNAFPSRIQALIRENDRLAQSNRKTGGTFVDLWAKMKTVFTGLKSGIKSMMSMLEGTMEYNETVNRFNVSLGEYAEEAGEYANKVSAVLGIDPAEWMDGQAKLMTLAKGFGVAGDRAKTMSTNLTQLAYDLSSFEDISVEDAMTKIKSGLAGEIEPLRAVGYDLSQARLQQEAYAMGINKKISAMTQAEKAELRYVAIIKSSTLAQGDMARTLESPSNQLRIFKAQVTQAARSVGNIFIPILIKVLPILTAVVQVMKTLADIIASLFGTTLPEVANWGGSSLASGAEDYSDALEDAAGNAKKLKQYTMGFDELNVIDPNKGSSSDTGVGIGGGGFDFDLPTYEFIDEETKNRAIEIADKMKEWLGLGEEINSWADLFKTRLGGILVLVGIIGVALLAWKVIQTVANVSDVFSKLGWGKTGDGGTGGGGDSGVSIASTKLKTLAKNLGLGIAIIAEVVVAAALFIGGIWLMGVLLEQVGIAWQPVIDNAGTIAIAIGIGTALLVTIGLVTAGLGTLGGPVAGQIGIGIGILAEISVATDLFLAEIWVIGKLLDEIGKAWKPVLDNGKTIEKGIEKGTVLLIAIGVVTAVLGAATVASAGALPLAIGLGTAILVELGAAFVLFCDSLIEVADKLSDDLHPALEDLNGVLPDLNDNMEDFVAFMKEFAEMTVEYTKSSAISGFSSTVESIVKFFTKDPIKSLASDVEKQYKQSVTLNKNLGLANPELQTATSDLGTYKSRIDTLKGVVDTIDTSDMATLGFTNLVKIGEKIAEFGGELKKYYNKIKDIKTATMDKMVACINDVIDFAVRIKNEVETEKIDDFTSAIKRLTSAIESLPTSKTVTIKAVYQSSGTSPQGFATGGFPSTGQLFVAREAGPEMVGSIGRKTAVVNNDQIVAGIASGVASANTESNALLREQNGLLRAMLEKESNISLDGKAISKSVDKHRRERGVTLVTGGAY